jgi:Putative adhesin
MSNWEFPGSEPIDILIDIPAGSVAVSGEAVSASTVDLRASRGGPDADWLARDISVSFREGRLEVVHDRRASGFLRGDRSIQLTVRVPAGSRCTVHTASADVSCVGELASLDARTASGDLTAATVTGELKVKTASGDVWVEQAGTPARVETASGDVRVREASGEVRMTSASGDLSVSTAGGSVTAQTASGDVRIASIAAGEASVRTVSGDTLVGVAPGADVYLDLSSLTGRIRSHLQETGEAATVALKVMCRSVSGDIQIARATA